MILAVDLGLQRGLMALVYTLRLDNTKWDFIGLSSRGPHLQIRGKRHALLWFHPGGPHLQDKESERPDLLVHYSTPPWDLRND